MLGPNMGRRGGARRWLSASRHLARPVKLCLSLVPLIGVAMARASRRPSADGAQPAGDGGRRASGLGLAGTEPRHRRRIGGKRRHAACGAPDLKAVPVGVVDQPGGSGTAGGGITTRGIPLPGPTPPDCRPPRPAQCRPCLPSSTAGPLGRPPLTASAGFRRRIVCGSHYLRKFPLCPRIFIPSGNFCQPAVIDETAMTCHLIGITVFMPGS